MAEPIVLSASKRARTGKGGARQTRRDGQIPAIVYGAGVEPTPISVEPGLLRGLLASPNFFNQLIALDIEGETQRVLCRDLQLDPIRDTPIHLDLMRVSESTRVNVEVPVTFVNESESPGLGRGGLVNIIRHTVEVICRADAIPEAIIVDLTGLDIGDSVHFSHVAVAEGVRPAIADRDFTIATIAAPTLTVEPTEEGEEGEEEEGEGEAEAEEEV